MALKDQPITVCYVAWNTSTNAGQTGDAGNHTLKLVQDGTEGSPTNSPSEVDSTNLKGLYKLALTAGDMNYNCVVLGGASSTSNVVIIPLVIVTERGVLPTAAAGASGGAVINGSNAGPLSISGGVSITNSGGDALELTSTGGNGNGLNATANGTGSGIAATGGATGHGVLATGGATSGSGFKGASPTSGDGIHATGAGTGHGANLAGGATGNGLNLIGGSTSGYGLGVATTSGDGIHVAPTAGNAATLAAGGTSTHGLSITGGTAGTSDGLHCVAGTGGVAIRGGLASNALDAVITEGTLNLPQTVALVLDVLTSIRSGVPSSGSSGTITVKDPTGSNTRISITVDSSGDITAVTYTPPSV